MARSAKHPRASLKDMLSHPTFAQARRERMEAAGGRLLAAAFDFMGELFPAGDAASATPRASSAAGLGNRLYDSLADALGRAMAAQ